MSKTSQTTRIRARAELELRKRNSLSSLHVQKARTNFLDFVSHTYPTYQAEPAHMVIADHLEAVLHGDIKRLMIFAPPQSGKSELVSVRFPGFWLSHRPDEPVIFTSYAASLAHSKSWEARNVVESPQFQEIFPEILTNKTRRAGDHWYISGHRGFMLAAGVGGPITGHGAMLGIIDDPIENWQQAQSQTIRDNVWNWWKSTFRTRIREGGAIILIMTRWHEDDLAGRIIKDQGKEWTILRLPALAETNEEREIGNRLIGLNDLCDPIGRLPGEALCPGRFKKETLEKISKDVGPMVWNAEYQGVPRAPEGNRFKREWFEIVEAIPTEIVRLVRYWDKAGTKDGGAYTSGILLGITPNHTIYIIDVVRGQWEYVDREAIIKQTAKLDSDRFGSITTWIEQEPGSGGKESAEATIRNLSGYAVFADRVTGSKDVRLEPFAAQSGVKNVKLVRADWNWNWLEEICAIPNSKYRDQGDSTAGAFNKLTLGESGGTFGIATMRR